MLELGEDERGVGLKCCGVLGLVHADGVVSGGPLALESSQSRRRKPRL
jgi:hypothetical protein